MTSFKSMPLGIDIGQARVRVAAAERDRDGNVRLRAFASSDMPDCGAEEAMPAELTASIIEALVAEIGTKERRCVLAAGGASAALRVVAFPKMTWAERTRAAKFEAQRFAPWDVDAEPTAIRVHPFDRAQSLFAVGAIKRSALDARVALAKKAGLRPICVDHDAFALQRVLPFCDAVLDVGAAFSTLHAFEGAPFSLTIPGGGMAITDGIARDLSVDAKTAERRKRILGVAGAGAQARKTYIAEICGLIERARSRTNVTRIALTGNGARLPGLAEGLEDAAGAVVDARVAEVLLTDAYPEDVIRAAAPDWTLAAALATRGAYA